MNKTDAAKLAQAYQWLAEEKEVECLRYGQWWPWDGWVRDVGEFRIKPEPAPLLELWVNIRENGAWVAFSNRHSALDNVGYDTTHAAVHFRAEREPDIHAMVKRFLAYKLPDEIGPLGSYFLTPGQAEQMIRHILGEEK